MQIFKNGGDDHIPTIFLAQEPEVPKGVSEFEFTISGQLVSSPPLTVKYFWEQALNIDA
jgi:hypothetical protein